MTGGTTTQITHHITRDLLRSQPPELVQFVLALAKKIDGMAFDDIPASLRLDLQLRLPSLVSIDKTAKRIKIRDSALAKLLTDVETNINGAASGENDPLTRFHTLISAAALEEALVLFRREGGAFFSMVHGLNVALAVMDLFPEDIRNSNETLVLASAVNALKAGNISRANFIIQERFTTTADKLPASHVPIDATNADFQCFRYINAIYMEDPISARDLELLFDLLGQLPLDASVQRGLLYTVALDVFLRQHKWDTAAEAALRSRHHFENARATLLAFYVDLYLGIINIVRGHLTEGRIQLEDGGKRLGEFADATPNDHQLLTAFQFIAAYELGEPNGLIDFALSEDQESRFGEIWPSVAEPIIAYGSLALSTHVTLAAARSFLARWRLQEWRSDRFVQIVDLHEVAILQAHRRWHEGDDLLQKIATARGLGERVDFSKLRRSLYSQRDNIDLAIAALRSAIEQNPADKEALAAFDQINLFPNTTPRQNAQAELWKSVAYFESGNDARRREALLAFFEIVQKRQLDAVLIENREVIERACGNRNQRVSLLRSPQLAKYLRDLPDQTKSKPSNPTDLTRQEERVLFLLSESAPNKTIAHRLGISVPTVKFHLKNIYRKLDASGRADAIAISVERGLISH